MVIRMTPHRQLLAEYAESGSEQAFRDLVEACIGLVYGCALRWVDGRSQLAEDITQTVFTDLARKAKTLSPEVLVGGWLHRRTCHAAATAMRSERRRLIREREAVEMNLLNSDETMAGVRPILDEAIDQLPEADRDAIVLRFFERWNHRAIGDALGTTEAAAQKRVERALEKLRVLLARRGVALTVAALAVAVGSASATAAPAGLAITVSTTALASATAGAGVTLSTLKIMAMTKLKITVIAATIALLAAGTATTVLLERDPSYTPPPNPDPQQILYQAQADATAGRYKDALAKHIWYRNNALRYQPAQVGVRDSFALMYWATLAEKYPPAMKRLKAIHDQAVRDLHDSRTAPKDAMTAYIVAISVNNGLHDGTNSVELFKWVDAHNPAVARQVYSIAENDLISAGEYELCGKYVDADKSYQRIVSSYHQLKNLPSTARTQQLADFAVKNFTDQSARLVAVLAINNRQDEADRVADQAEKEVNNQDFATLLAKARTGSIPPR
jgi:RNA polymerase sigma factor (sigma-70 family)